MISLSVRLDLKVTISLICVQSGDKKVTAGESDMDIVLLEDEPKEEDEHAMSVEEILNINRELGVQDVEGQRVLQVSLSMYSSLDTRV